MEIILDRHLVTMEKFVAERRRRARGAEAMPPSVGRGAFKLYFFRDHQ
jgi:hypothetical protein